MCPKFLSVFNHQNDLLKNFDDYNSVDNVIKSLRCCISRKNEISRYINKRENNYILNSLNNLDINNKLNFAIEQLIIFYEKVSEIEKVLNKKFKPKVYISEKDLQNIERLYSGLIQKKPCKDYINAHKLNITTSEDIIEEKSIKNKCVIKISTIKNYEVLGTDIKLPYVIIIYNMKITKLTLLETEDEINDYILDIDRKDGKKIFTAEMCFKDEDSYKAYLKNNDDLVDRFRQAEEIII